MTQEAHMATKPKTAQLRAPRVDRTATAAPRVDPIANSEADSHVVKVFRATEPQDLLRIAADTIANRGRMRDTNAGQGEAPAERSMAATVAAFNALEGTTLTESQGWRFMQVLKLARAAASARNGVHNPDDYVDGAAYAALGNEAAEHAAMAAALANNHIDPAALQ